MPVCSTVWQPAPGSLPPPPPSAAAARCCAGWEPGAIRPPPLRAPRCSWFAEPSQRPWEAQKPQADGQSNQQRQQLHQLATRLLAAAHSVLFAMQPREAVPACAAAAVPLAAALPWLTALSTALLLGEPPAPPAATAAVVLTIPLPRRSCCTALRCPPPTALGSAAAARAVLWSGPTTSPLCSCLPCRWRR